ncbi:hypothetical protein [Endozoicomonas sp. 2B-B]
MNNVNTPAAVGVSTSDLTKPVQPQSKQTGAGFGWVITKADQGELLSHQGLQQAGSQLQGDRASDRRVVTINTDGIANIYNRKADGSFAKEALRVDIKLKKASFPAAELTLNSQNKASRKVSRLNKMSIANSRLVQKNC